MCDYNGNDDDCNALQRRTQAQPDGTETHYSTHYINRTRKYAQTRMHIRYSCVACNHRSTGPMITRIYLRAGAFLHHDGDDEDALLANAHNGIE